MPITFKASDPATGADGPDFTEATEQNVAAAVVRATHAARDPRLADGPRRVVLLRTTGMTAIDRFLRPVTLQDAPAALLPAALQDGNPLGLWRRVDGELTKD